MYNLFFYFLFLHLKVTSKVKHGCEKISLVVDIDIKELSSLLGKKLKLLNNILDNDIKTVFFFLSDTN